MIQNYKNKPYFDPFWPLFMYQTVSFLSFEMAFIKPFLSSLDKWIIDYRSKP